MFLEGSCVFMGVDILSYVLYFCDRRVFMFVNIMCYFCLLMFCV